MMNLIYRIKMRWKYNQCHNHALDIAKMGQNNVGQNHLNIAKNELYAAAIRFKKESEN